jgi:hypothetical protein
LTTWKPDVLTTTTDPVTGRDVKDLGQCGCEGWQRGHQYVDRWVRPIRA